MAYNKNRQETFDGKFKVGAWKQECLDMNWGSRECDCQ